MTDPDEVPTYQVKEFAPDLTLGGSASREPLVALALGDTWSRDRDLIDAATTQRRLLRLDPVLRHRDSSEPCLVSTHRS